MWFKLIFFFFAACSETFDTVYKQVRRDWELQINDRGEVSRKKGKFTNVMCQIPSYHLVWFTIEEAFWMTGETFSRNHKEALLTNCMIKTPR